MRLNIVRILQDPEQRKTLLIDCLIATQAREGRVISRQRAEEVYELILKERTEGRTK